MFARSDGAAQTGRRSDESVVPLAYGVQRCIDLIEDAEATLNMTFAFVVRARPDLLWGSIVKLGRRGGARAGQRGLLRLRLKAWGCPPHS